MSLSRRDALVAGAAVPVTTLWSALAAAQEPRPAAQPGTAGQPSPAGAGKDPLLAACLLLGGKRQIEVCQYAMSKLRMDETKAFAKAEIEEHEAIGKKLRELGYDLPAAAPRPGGEPPRPGGGGAQPQPVPPGAAPGAQPQPAPAGAPPQPPAGGRGPNLTAVGKFPLPPGAGELLSVELEVKEQCVANYKKEMEKKEGVKFEKGFVGDQLHEHMGLLDRAQVFQRHASPEMQKVLAEGQGVIERHIATLKAIMEKLDGMPDKK